jgi:aspartyl-tRNA(Asn)/glutamyl-tRNA(Gln) amidotransferase subunit A
MARIEPFSLSAVEISSKVQAGALSPRDVADHFIERTERLAPKLNSHLYWNRDQVLAQVERVEKRLAAGERLPLAGVPVVVKDNICTQDAPTTCASKLLSGYQPPYDAAVVEKLRAAGAVLFGKANLDEFAMGSSNENSAYGAVRNPFDTERVPGGSSGGSAAAVAAGLAPVALGSDTGGSIRQPAAFCGIVGVKPTYGRISRFGLVAFGSSLDQIGPMTRSVADAALVLDVLSGHDGRDSTSSEKPATAAQSGLQSGEAPKRIGVVKELMGDGLDAGTRAAVTAALAQYEKLGCRLVEVSLPYIAYSIAAYYIIATAEASANLARFDGVRYGVRADRPGQSLKDMYRRTRSQGFGREVKQRIMLGTFALSSGYYDAYYAKANRARQLIADDFAKAFAQVDLLATPVAPTTAFKIGEKAHDPLAMYLGDICTLAVNLAGLPALSLPCGRDATGLPVGLQLIAPAFAEESLLKGAQAYEHATRWSEQLRPSL